MNDNGDKSKCTPYFLVTAKWLNFFRWLPGFTAFEVHERRMKLGNRRQFTIQRVGRYPRVYIIVYRFIAS